MISAILFDMGGTLDGDGLHWLDRFYTIYEQIGLQDLPKSRIKEAFYWADAQADSDVAIRTSSLREMIQRHVRWQFQKLGLQNHDLETKAAAAFIQPAERVMHRNRRILETLSFDGFKKGIISNFYGNITTLCHEFGYTPFMNVLLDSAVVGLKK